MGGSGIREGASEGLFPSEAGDFLQTTLLQYTLKESKTVFLTT